MKTWGTMRMTNKLLVAPVAGILFLVFLGIVDYVSLLKQMVALDDIFNNRFGHYRVASEIVLDLKEARTSVVDLVYSARDAMERLKDSDSVEKAKATARREMNTAIEEEMAR